MASASEIAEAAQRLLELRCATRIYELANNVRNDDAILQSTDVVATLVDMVCSWSGSNPNCALFTLINLLEGGVVAQSAIADAHCGKIFHWLAESVDNGHPREKDELHRLLIANHPLNDARLRGGFKPLVDAIRTIGGGTDDNQLMLLAAINELCAIAKPEELVEFRQSGGFDVLYAVAMGRSSDELIVKAQDQASVVVAKYLGVVDATSLQSRSELVRAISEDTRAVRVKIYALFGLSRFAVKSDAEALSIVDDGAVASLVTILRRDVVHQSESDLNRKLYEWLWEDAARLLANLADRNDATIRQRIVTEQAVAALLVLSCVDNALCVKAAKNALYGLIRDRAQANVVANMHGIPFLVELLQLRGQAYVKKGIPVVAILETQLLTSDANRQAFVRCDGAVALLVALGNSRTVVIREDAHALLQNLGDLIPLLLKILHTDADATQQRVTLQALEIQSRAPRNQPWFAHKRSLERLVEIVKMTNTSSPNEIKATTCRVLANVTSENDRNRILVTQSGAIPVFIDLLVTTGTNQRTKTAAIMALCNLASDDVNRATIGCHDGVIPMLVGVVRHGTLAKQRQAAAALLGNLGRLVANRNTIVAHGGIVALLAATRAMATTRQRETVAMALWVLVHDSPDCQKGLVETGAFEMHGMQAIKDAVTQQPNALPWARRLLVTLTSARV